METAVQVLTHRDFVRIDKDYPAAASVANLTYVSDREPGISRERRGTGFSYRYRGKSLTSSTQLERIRKLAIPPAWQRVWICPDADGHIQATGYDARNRKQYRYHQRWAALQHETKFHRMIEFGKALPRLRAQVKKDLDLKGFPEAKVIAMVVALMERTFIRVGNDDYEKLYGSYGLTTLKNDHVNIRGDQITFSFKGKKGVYHRVAVKSRRFARIVKKCKAIPGKELFQYYDENGEPRKVDSGQVNAYLRNCLEMDFTTKDFRTWAGTLSMIAALKKAPSAQTSAELQRNITSCLQQVSTKLGNTVAVCRKYYVHPEIMQMYRERALDDFLTIDDVKENDREYHLAWEEEVLMRILRVVGKNKVEIPAA